MTIHAGFIMFKDDGQNLQMKPVNNKEICKQQTHLDPCTKTNKGQNF